MLGMSIAKSGIVNVTTGEIVELMETVVDGETSSKVTALSNNNPENEYMAFNFSGRNHEQTLADLYSRLESEHPETVRLLKIIKEKSERQWAEKRLDDAKEELSVANGMLDLFSDNSKSGELLKELALKEIESKKRTVSFRQDIYNTLDKRVSDLEDNTEFSIVFVCHKDSELDGFAQVMSKDTLMRKVFSNSLVESGKLEDEIDKMIESIAQESGTSFSLSQKNVDVYVMQV